MHPAPPCAIAIHGGAGALSRGLLTAAEEDEIHAALQDAVRAGARILWQGGASLDAVEVAVRVLEDCAWFNAGKGAVFDGDGGHELDAAIMDGATLRAGAVAGLRHSPHPVSVARAVMTHSAHVMLAGPGGDRFAREMGLPQVDNAWFDTPLRWRQFEQARSGAGLSLEPGAGDGKFGTVGAVAIDRAGHLAAATSTGGLTRKAIGRVGDSPLIGAGTYADDRSCAVSATGHGEFFIRHVAAHAVCARYRYLQAPLADCVHHVLFDELKPAGGEGGLIAVDGLGQLVLDFNTEGMYRAWCQGEGAVSSAIYGDEPAPRTSG